MRRPFVALIALLLLSSTVLFAQQKNWLDRLLPQKNPQVLESTPAKSSLVTPHPDVLNLQNSFAEVAEAVKPAVVNISAVQIQRVKDDAHQFYYGDPNDFFYRFFGEEPPQRRAPPQQQREFRTEGTGSGVIIDAEGYILTNNHVVQGADQLTVTLSSGKSLKGKVVGTDPRSDLAVIKIKGATPFPFVPLGDSGVMRVGDFVLAFGSPFGLEHTVTSGIVSAIRQSLNIEGKTFRNLIQTDAAINRGNSGGPLVNVRGEVIGVNTAIYAPTGVFSGIGFAIPINDAKQILKDLIQKGFVERSWMGVEIAEIDEVLAQQFGLKNTEGALINKVMPNSPADKAGIKRGDVIVEFNRKHVNTVQALQDMVTATPPKTTVPVKLVRNGANKVVNLTTEIMPNQESERNDEEGGSPNAPADEKTVKWLGATATNLTDASKRRVLGDENDSNTNSGVILTDVPANSEAAEAGLQEGDIIQAVNQTPVKSIADLKNLKADLKKGIVLDVVRGGRSFYLSYKSLQ